MRVARFLRDTSGQSLVLGAVCSLVVIAFLGLAVDIGSLEYHQRQLRTAAEVAALSGALEVTPCNGTTTCTAMQDAAKSSLAENGLTVSSTALNCGTASGSGLTLVLNNPPCSQGVSDPNHGNNNFVEAVVSEDEPTYFSRVIGFSDIPLTARAEASRTGNPNCIYALDPSGANAITVDVLATLNATCGVVDESSSPYAFTCSLLSYVNAPQLKVTGGSANLLCNTTPPPRTHVPVPVPADPLAYLPKPAVSACGTSLSSPYSGSPIPLLIAGNATLYPDHAYCGGIVLLPTANVTFMPGTYVIRSGGLLGLQGGLSFDLGSTINGNGVTFYNYGPVGGVNFVLASLSLGNVTLKAPTSGTYAGVLFFQDPGNTTSDVILGNANWNTVIEGAYYFPTSTVTCAVSGPAKYNILVAKDIVFAALTFASATLSTTSFGNNYSTLSAGSPLAGGGSVLVQ